VSETKVQFGIALPQIVDQTASVKLAPFARRAEELGFSYVWVSELTGAPILDPLHVLSHVASVTTTIRLGVAVVLTPLRVPLQLARDTATIDRLSAGRLTLGVGLGSNRELYRQYGLPVERRVSRYVEGLDALHALWTGRSVEGPSSFWELQDAHVIAPVQRPHPPLWFGARRGEALRRAAQLGDGWIVSGSAPPSEVRHALVEMRQHLEDFGKSSQGFPVAKRVYVAIANDRKRAKERLTEWFGANYGKPGMAEEVGIVGSTEEVREHIEALRASGVTHILLNPVFDELEQMEILAAELVPTINN
jgi:alkanesulfonate monooxygenase SsuD/methylene tetrahydromethanopterin reductase-like flavin-dependent oxidoreductase (luciferase family)